VPRSPLRESVRHPGRNPCVECAEHAVVRETVATLHAQLTSTACGPLDDLPMGGVVARVAVGYRQKYSRKVQWPERR
jgi:hypothetical protein